MSAALGLMAVLGEAAPFAQQQDPPRGGAQEVFGGAAAANPNQTQSIDLSMTIAEAYDQNLMADLGGVLPSPYQLSGTYTMLTPQLDVALRGQRVQFTATGGSNLRYYSGLGKVYTLSDTAGTGLSVQVDPSTTLTFSGSAGYAPAYLYGLLAGLAPAGLGAGSPTPSLGDFVAGAADYQTTSEQSYTYSTSVGLTHAFGERASFTMIGDYRYTDFVGHMPGYFNMPAFDVGGHWSYAVNRDTKLRFGYTYRDATYAPGLQPTEHDVDMGLDYVHPLSATRKASVGFSIGPTLVNGFTAGPQLSPVAGYHYALVGNAFYNRQFGRTWHARGSVNRSLAYIQGIAAPVYNNAANVETGGFLGSRVDLFFSAAYALGSLAGAQASAGQFTSYAGDARLRIGLTREWAAFVEGLAYDYAFSQNLLLPGLPSHFTRNGVRVGLTLWLPVRSR